MRNKLLGDLEDMEGTIMTTGPAGGLYKPYKGMVPAALEALE